MMVTFAANRVHHATEALRNNESTTRFGHVYDETVSRPQLKPGAHGHIAVTQTTAALRSRGAFVAHARVRPLDGGNVQIVRRFGPTERDALSALQAAIVERVGAVSEANVVSVVDRRILAARLGFARLLQPLLRLDSSC